MSEGLTPEQQMDLVVYGVAYTDAETGQRIDPRTVAIERSDVDPAEEFMKAVMLRAARFAPRGGRIRFRAIDRTVDGDRVVRSAEIATEDARRLAGEQ